MYLPGSMAARRRPALRQIGDVVRDLRERLGISQDTAAAIMQVDQAALSKRERGVTRFHFEELVRFEDAYGLQRGEVLRRAGYVVDAHTPPEQIDTWSSFLTAKDRGLLHFVVDPAWEEAQQGPEERG